ADKLAQQLDGDAAMARHHADLEAAQAAATEAERMALAAEAKTQEAQAALEAARPALQEIEKTLNRLEAEAQTLRRFLNAGGVSLGPAIVDQLTVASGYETALGAALGDDLEASSDAGAPLHWAGPVDGATDAPLPGGVVPLSRFVSGSDLLKRRLVL